MHNYTACCGLLLRKKKTKFTTWERVFDVRTAIVVDQSDGGDYPTTSQEVGKRKENNTSEFTFSCVDVVKNKCPVWRYTMERSQRFRATSYDIKRMEKEISWKEDSNALQEANRYWLDYLLSFLEDSN